MLSGLTVGDLYLACGCALMDGGAIALFEKRFMRDIDAALGRGEKEGRYAVAQHPRAQERQRVCPQEAVVAQQEGR